MCTPSFIAARSLSATGLRLPYKTASHTVAESRRLEREPYGNAPRTTPKQNFDGRSTSCPSALARRCCIGLGTTRSSPAPSPARKGGACPMMAAHREGGRTSCCTFPEAWDKFTGVYGRSIVRPATEYEVHDPLPGDRGEPGAAAERPSDAIAEHQASRVGRAEREQAAGRRRSSSAASSPRRRPPRRRRKRRLRITGGHIDLSEAIDEHKTAARSRRSREADGVRLDWLFESTLVCRRTSSRGRARDEPPPQEFDFDSAEAELTRLRSANPPSGRSKMISGTTQPGVRASSIRTAATMSTSGSSPRRRSGP